jgi:hypothetical protein
MFEKMLSPEELRITPKEYDALLKTRKLLADGEIKFFDVDRDYLAPGQYFSMDIAQTGRECGTVCCIGGWMKRLMCSHVPTDREVWNYVAAYHSKPLYKLFWPLRDENGADMYDDWGDPYDFPTHLIDPTYAVEAIDNFFRTSDPNWPCVLKLENA